MSWRTSRKRSKRDEPSFYEGRYSCFYSFSKIPPIYITALGGGDDDEMTKLPSDFLS